METKLAIDSDKTSTHMMTKWAIDADHSNLAEDNIQLIKIQTDKQGVIVDYLHGFPLLTTVEGLKDYPVAAIVSAIGGVAQAKIFGIRLKKAKENQNAALLLD